MVVVFLILTVFGVVIQSQDHCHAHCHEVSAINSGLSQKGIQLGEQKIVTTEHVDETESATFHVCHLGHCSFVLESIVSFFSINPKHILVVRPQFFSISDFHSNLYRPPIS